MLHTIPLALALLASPALQDAPTNPPEAAPDTEVGGPATAGPVPVEPGQAPKDAGTVPAPGAPPVLAPVDDDEVIPRVHAGELLDPELAFGPGVIETWDVVLEREAARPRTGEINRRARNDAQGTWVTPSRRHSFYPRSGDRYVFNRWGDARMGIGFNALVDVEGAWFAGQGARGLWAEALQAVGYREGVEVARSGWFEDIDETPAWFAMGLERVDRIEILARPAFRGAGWYGMDDLTFTRLLPADELDAEPRRERVVLDFEDVEPRSRLTGSGYAGLDWERGTGEFEQDPDVVHTPLTPPGLVDPEPTTELLPVGVGGATPPDLLQDFEGPKIFDAGAGWLPPDTCGAVGVDHYVSVVNQNMSVYDKATGVRLIDVGLNGFWPSVSNAGDPRVTFDPHSERFFAIATDFSTKVHIAVTLSSDPTGPWYKNSIVVSQGSDSDKWPDYPTLGVDAQGVYTSSYMVGGGMSLFAIDKAPLIAATPSLGAVTAFRNLPWEGAIQPCVTYGDPGKAYSVSRRSSTTLRLRSIVGPPDAPSLVEEGWATIPSHGSPPDAPALGSVAPLDALDWRPMNAVFRNGSVWTTHGVAVSSRAAVRWYEIDPVTLTTVQTGTIADPSLHYFMPSISVNVRGDVVLGFTGSDANQYAGAYYTGRRDTDAPGTVAAPVLYRAGQGPYNTVDANGVNRWGDYSLTSVDPVDDLTLWTIQEYSRGNDQWGTWIAKLLVPGCQTWQTYCVTSPNSAGSGALIGAAGSASVLGGDLVFPVVGLPPNQFALLYYGAEQIQVPFGEGVRCVGAGGISTFRAGIEVSDFLGDAQFALDYGSPPASAGIGLIDGGSLWNFQVWYRDPAGGPSGFNLSDAIQVAFCP